MTTTADHVLLIGFGGPTKLEEVPPFLRRVTEGFNVPEVRIQEVQHHYEAVGGRSRYNDDTFRLMHQLQANLRQRSATLPVMVGMRNWHPFLEDVIPEIARQGLTQGIGVILAPHRSPISFDRYVQRVEAVVREAKVSSLSYRYVPPWHDHALFIEAQAARAREALETISAENLLRTHVIFSAHSIPVAVAERCAYAQEIEVSSQAVARALGHVSWSVAYQSRSGTPRERWLTPDVESAIREAKVKGARHVMVVPIGFSCENVEVLFDLDLEAREEAERIGIGFTRASTVLDHPAFVEMFAQLILEPVHVH